ncbi:hypothetical protein [Jatrophihabitans endophyticus]|uniref:hypothetical protein n=1 Tax=Jatrophihabitans endophyticus TaxID=1206085 RepID=UPI001A0CA164|nr:hypothetical protein [Jatrophihabitans endophyticus]MBE7188238.1 hypothetical protein [Jatrophihabitans endophyticus]
MARPGLGVVSGAHDPWLPPSAGAFRSAGPIEAFDRDEPDDDRPGTAEGDVVPPEVDEDDDEDDDDDEDGDGDVDVPLEDDGAASAVIATTRPAVSPAAATVAVPAASTARLRSRPAVGFASMA